MPTPTPVTAIFDIGKTNKKFLLFDENYAVIEKHQTEFEQTVDDDGDPCEDLEKIESWIKRQIDTANKEYRIQALNFSAYGASLVHIDKNGDPVTPLYNYLKTYPDELLHQFYESVGGKEKFSLETASPPMGMLNSGLQLYWLEHQKPELFKQIEATLHFPNYLSYLFSGKRTSELTSIGCHTSLWEFEKVKYHNWLMKSELTDLFPSIQDVFKAEESEEYQKIGPGVHDSSSALAPYLIGLSEPFILISTGTWSITLNPFNNEPLTYEELERDCLCYLDIYGRQVKASRLFLGAEYTHQKKKIAEYFSNTDESFDMELDVDLMNQRVQRRDPEFQLELEQAYNSGPFPQDQPGDWQVNRFSSRKEAYHQLMLDLVSIQAESIKLALGSKEIDKIIVTGGFSQNKFFGSLLASFFSDKKVYTSKLTDASALGAAMVVNENKILESGASQACNDLKGLLGLKRVKLVKDLNVNDYLWKT